MTTERERKAFEAGRVLALSGLFRELNKLRWIGADEGWQLAIKAVREEIAKRVNEEPTLADMLAEAQGFVPPPLPESGVTP